MTDSWHNSQDFSDDAIRRFLFGRLTPAEQTTFEERLLTDDAFETRLHLAEIELADDYALARLSATERRAFEEKFLLTADRKRMLDVSTALRDHFASTSTSETAAKGSFGERLRFGFGLNQRRWQFALGAVVIVVLIAAAWLALREVRNRREAYSPPVVRSSPSPVSKREREAEHPGGAASPAEHQTSPAPMPPHEPTVSPAIVSVALLPGAVADDEQLARLSLPRGEHDVVRLQLTLKLKRTGTYQAEILTVDGRSVFVSQSRSANGADTIDVDIPAASLTTGVYQVKLVRFDEVSKVRARYYFRVQ